MAINKNSIVINDINDIQVPDDSILVCNLDVGERKIGNIYIPDDDLKLYGIRPRNAQIFKVGENYSSMLNVGDWVMIRHGNWSQRMHLYTKELGDFKVWIVPKKCIAEGLILKYEKKPNDTYEELEYNIQENKWRKV